MSFMDSQEIILTCVHPVDGGDMFVPLSQCESFSKWADEQCKKHFNMTYQEKWFPTSSQKSEDSAKTKDTL